MSLAVTANKTGRLFREGAGILADQIIDKGIEGAQSAALQAIMARTPVRTGALKSTLVSRGEMLSRSVVATSPYSVAVDQGYVPASKRRYTVGRRIKGGKRKFLKAAKIQGQQFFYATFQAIKGMLTAQYLAPCGAMVIRALDRP